jgi:hypothetical protein
MVRIASGSSTISSVADDAVGEGSCGVAGGGVGGVAGDAVSVPAGIDVAAGDGVASDAGVAMALGARNGGADVRELGSGVASRELHDTDRTDRTTRAVRRITFL